MLSVKLNLSEILGFNHGWTTTMSTKPSFMEVCDGFLNKESLAQMTLREDAVGVGGNGMEQKTSRALARVHQRKDMRALCMDWGKMHTSDYLHYVVNNFSTS